MLSKEEIQALKNEHGARLYCHIIEDGRCVVVAPAKRVVFKLFVDQSQDDSIGKSVAMENLVRQCVVYPSKEEFQAIWEEYAGIIVPLAAELQRLSGAQRSSEGKDL